MGDEPLQQKWFQVLSERERLQVLHALTYAGAHADAGAPGHSQFLLIARLVELIGAVQTDGAIEQMLADPNRRR